MNGMNAPVPQAMSSRPHLSQSEAADWATCPMRAWGRWILGYRPPDDETRPQRIGSIGHALLAERVLARHAGREPDYTAAVEREATRRRWQVDTLPDLARALPAADQIAETLRLDSACLLPDLYSTPREGDEPRPPGGRPLAEVRLRATWSALASFMEGRGWCDLAACNAVRDYYAGIEGQPDLVYLPEGPGGAVVVPDYKFRQSPDLGGAAADPESTVPDKQASWYLALLHAVGLRPPSGLEFWQVNAYAGAWLSVDDFLRVAEGGAESEEEAGLVLKSGLPTCDLKRIGKVGHVSAETWGEAHRHLTNVRHNRRLSNWQFGGGKGRAPERLTATEEGDALAFLATLRAYEPVVVRRFRADPTVCREVVRDMIVGVDGPLGHVLRGMTPARNLQNYRTSPCVRPYGCALQAPCRASLGTFSIRDTLADLADQGALQSPMLDPAAAELML